MPTSTGAAAIATTEMTLACDASASRSATVSVEAINTAKTAICIATQPAIVIAVHTSVPQNFQGAQDEGSTGAVVASVMIVMRRQAENGLPFSGTITFAAAPFISATNASAVFSMIGKLP